MLPTLYQLTQDYQDVLAMTHDSEIEEQAIKDTLESISEVIDVKLENISHIINANRNRIQFLRDEEVRLTEQRRVLENREHSLKQYMFESMKAVGKTKVQTDHYTVAIQKNGGKRKLTIDADATVPEEYLRTIVEPDNNAIREELEAGIELSFARLEPQGESIRIR